ncbi:MAG: AI-2E family transporter [Gammaproteobacteria bacterium]|nr:AI-2E family transporter [Gammaproteobacteria bacterium]
MSDSQKWWLLALTGFSGWLIYLLSPVLMPFVFSAVLAYLGDPLTDKLEAKRLSRTQAVTVVFLTMALIFAFVLFLLIPHLEVQISNFIGNLPAYADKINNSLLPWLSQRFKIDLRPLDINELINVLKSHWQNAGGLAETAMNSLTKSGSAIIAWLMNLLLIPVVTFYLLRDWDILGAKIYRLLPRRIAPVAAKLAGEVDTVLSAFLRGQFYVMLALAGIYSIGLWLTGLDVALLIGFLAGMVSFVPYLGAIVGIISACTAALVQFHEITSLIPVAVVFLVGQTLEGTVLTPKLVGGKIGLHPVAVIFSVMAGGQLFGFLGILLALPVASIIMVFLRHIHDIYRDSEFYGKG